MSKRKVQFSDAVDFAECVEQSVNTEEPESAVEPELESGQTSDADSSAKFGKRFKHTLDSDEEDDELIEQNYNVLDVDEIAGQEEATVEADGDVRITPFNMKEELESGHFDKEGNYIFDKTEEIRDNWLDHIDWLQIKPNSEATQADTQSQSDDESDPKSEIDLNEVYKQMIELMAAKESVQKAIQRLGKSCGKYKTSDRWKRTKDTDNEKSDQQMEAKEKLLKLSSLADQVLTTGDMNIYEKTYEQLAYTLKKASEVSSVESDMFSEDFDSNKTIDPKTESDNEIKWEFKWEDKDSSQVFGPHTSRQMLSWVNEGYFENGVYVRQIGKTDSQFYSSKRIDFDLYD